MSEVVVAQRMWQRRDTAANWTSVNPVLNAGEIGAELPAGGTGLVKFKIGDGSTAWTGLPYAGGGVDGKQVELQAAGGFIQWRYVGDAAWQNLVSLASLQGPQGTAGAAGASAYDVAVANGFVGTQADWLASLKGDTGAAGTAYARRIQVISAGAGTIACDWGSYDEIRITLTANVVLTFSGAIDGQGCVLKLKQDATGGRTVQLPASVRMNALIGSYSATATGGKADKIGFVYDGTDSKYDFVSSIPGIG